jgi:hypothetical protein
LEELKLEHFDASTVMVVGIVSGQPNRKPLNVVFVF